MNQDVKNIVVTAEQLAARISELGTQITADYSGKKLVVLGILKGAAPFTTDLMRAIDLDFEMDFLAASSYGSGTQTSGEVRMLKDTALDLAGKDILVVEDIFESGYTLDKILEVLRGRGAASVRLCVLLEKPGTHAVDIPIDYLGFHIPNEFIVGYGLDYAEHYRGLPYIGVLKPEVYQK